MHLRTPDKHSLLVIVILFIKMSIKKYILSKLFMKNFIQKIFYSIIALIIKEII